MSTFKAGIRKRSDQGYILRKIIVYKANFKVQSSRNHGKNAVIILRFYLHYDLFPNIPLLPNDAMYVKQSLK